jgi:hypothetical protein
MATFNQQRQTVNHQINADTVFVGDGAQRLAGLIGELIAQLPDGSPHRDKGSPLRLAHQAALEGKTARAVGLLRTVAEVAGPVSTLAASVVTILQAFR